MIIDEKEYLAHVGVLGMKWGKKGLKKNLELAKGAAKLVGKGAQWTVGQTPAQKVQKAQYKAEEKAKNERGLKKNTKLAKRAGKIAAKVALWSVGMTPAQKAERAKYIAEEKTKILAVKKTAEAFKEKAVVFGKRMRDQNLSYQAAVGFVEAIKNNK